jgi:hypothetical protein
LIFRSLLFCDVSKVVLLHDSTFPPLIWCFMIRTEHLDRLDNIIVVFTLSLDQNLSGEKTQPLSKGFFFWLNGLVSPSTMILLAYLIILIC